MVSLAEDLLPHHEETERLILGKNKRPWETPEYMHTILLSQSGCKMISYKWLVWWWCREWLWRYGLIGSHTSLLLRFKPTKYGITDLCDNPYFSPLIILRNPQLSHYLFKVLILNLNFSNLVAYITNRISIKKKKNYSLLRIMLTWKTRGSL